MIQSVERALDIMMCISDKHGRPATISEISETTHLNKSTCCHIIDTLVERGFLDQVSRSSGYVLGVYAYNLTRYKDFQRDLIFTGMPILRWMQSKCGSTTILANLINGDKFVLCYSENPDNPLKDRGDIYKGTLYDSATGRAMLSTLKTKELKAIVERIGLPKPEEWKNIYTFEKLEEELNKISKQKIVKVQVESKGYFCRIATPFLGPRNERFALGIELKKESRPTTTELEYIDKILITGVNEIKRRMKFENIKE